MRLEQERNQVVDYGRELIRSELTTGTGGNISVLNRREGLAAISPSGMNYFDLRAEQIPVINLEGKQDGTGCKPSSEWQFHVILYQKRADIGAVVHTHSAYATTLACLHWEIPAVHYLVGFAGKKVPLAPYATFGTTALARNIADTIGDCNAVLLANHGLVTVGPDLHTAFSIARQVEFVSRIYYQARCAGHPRLLSSREMDEVMIRFKTYGRQDLSDSAGPEGPSS